ncbi:MAG TPA: hypothetical protein ENF22_07080 [Chloroflexi bacterium]|nr:hypothetical protein [Chloroflexota bacterium]
MKKIFYLFMLSVILLLLAACSSKPTAVPVTETPEPTPELIEAAPTYTVESEESTPEDAVFEIEETKITLLVYYGDARISHDGGETWGLADTGLWLESGDRIQVTPGGIALILFPDGSLIRLEGFTDLDLVQSEFDFENGIKRVIGRVLEGSALVTTVPLPNPESLFQLWVMTSLIDLPYDPALAVPLDQAEQVPDDERISFGGTMREDFDGESLFSYSSLVDFYVLEIIEGEYVLIKTKPLDGQYSQYDIPFRDNIEDEFELEGLLDMTAGVIEQSRLVESITDLDFYGYSMIEEGKLSDNQTLFSVFPAEELAGFLLEDQAEKQEFVNYVSGTPSYKRHQLHYRYYKNIPDIFAEDILLLLEKYNLGCDIRSGLGCPLRDGCDRETGAGCELSSGCNPITRSGCEKAKLSCIAYTNCDWAPCGRRPVVSFFCKPRVRKYCDPDIPHDCDQYLTTSLDLLAGLGEMIGPTDLSSVTDTGTDGDSVNGQLEELAAYSLPPEFVQNPELAGEPLYDPNEPASVAPFYNNDYWEQLMSYYRDLFGSDEDDNSGDEDIEWCTCTASVPPGYPPPPPWMDMTYRCYCSD